MGSSHLDVGAAHRHFAAECFNRTWELLVEANRTREEDQKMVESCLASLWHWTQRDDCSGTNMSIGYWQASRVYSTIGVPGEARRYAKLCFDASNVHDVDPFYLGYAYEAMARAEHVAGEQEAALAPLTESRRIAERLTDHDAKQQLLADLEDLAQQLGA